MTILISVSQTFSAWGTLESQEFIFTPYFIKKISRGVSCHGRIQAGFGGPF